MTEDFLEELREAREVSVNLCNDTAEYLHSTRVSFDLDECTHEEVSNAYTAKMMMYAKTSDFLVSIKLSQFVLDRMKRKDFPSHLTPVFQSEFDALTAVYDDLTALRFACMDKRTSLEKVCIGLLEIKKGLFPRGFQ